MRAGIAASLFLVHLCPVVCSAAAAGGAHTLEYLYIEPNSGGSSGGHVAIRLDDTVYHFQQGDFGTIRLTRDPFDAFEHAYRALGNRRIRAEVADVSREAFEHLRRYIDVRYVVQRSHFDLSESFSADRTFLQYLTARHDPARAAASKEIAISAAGYFGEAGTTETLRSSSIVRIGTMLRGRSEGWLDERIASLSARVHALKPASDTTAPAIEQGKLAVGPTGYFERYRELVSEWLALSVLRGDYGPRADALATSGLDRLVLDEAELAKLAAWRSRLVHRVPELLESPRPDRATAVLVALVRLAAIDRSLATGRLHVPDPCGPDCARVSPDILDRYPSTLSTVVEEHRRDLAAALENFATSDATDELGLSQLEVAASRLIELERSIARHQTLHVYVGAPLPLKPGFSSAWPLPALDGDELAVALRSATRRARAYDSALVGLYGYDLFRRNCATELLRLVEEARNEYANTERNPSLARLAFMPAFSSDSFDELFDVRGRESRPSLRTLRLARLESRTPGLWLRLRESNTLTSQTYRWHTGDPYFLLFADDGVATRPAKGLANLVGALACTAAGMMRLTLGDVDVLRDGVMGVVYSFPELAFISMRKGTYELAPWRFDGSDEQR